MDGRLTHVLLASALVYMLLLNMVGVNSVSAQAGGPTSNRGVLGDVLEAAGLRSLVENLYFFRSMVVGRGGLDSGFLSWFTPIYADLSRSLLSLPAWSILRFVFLPAAIVVSVCLFLYLQIGLLGAVLTIGFLMGLIYVFPIFLAIEAFSKTGLVATHSKKMLTLLLLLAIGSTLSLLYAYGYHNIPAMFYSFIILSITLCFSWFLPILVYYQAGSLR